jgi:4,5-dihydroxyphthalate decarboxylase
MGVHGPAGRGHLASAIRITGCANKDPRVAKLPLTFACGFYDRVNALYTGEVTPEGIDLNFIPMDDPRQIFDRMGGGGEFDLCEMSASEYVTKSAALKCPYVALPVFLSRVFRHQFIYVNRKSRVKKAHDLNGARVGVQLYVQTAAVFIRGLLQHEYGVDLSSIQFIEGAMEHPGGHGKPTVLPVLKPIKLEQNRTGKSLQELLEDGEIDAVFASTIPECFGRNPDIVRLFPDFRAVEADYYRRTGIFPIMHLVVIRKDVHERHPFVASSLYNAFCEARDVALARMREVGAPRYMLPWLVDDIHEIDEVFGPDFWAYGVEKNRPSLEALVQYLHEQFMIEDRVKVDDLFAPTYGHPKKIASLTGREGWTTPKGLRS